MPRPTLALTGRLACLSGGLWSAVTRRCFELFSYVLNEIRQEVMQNFAFFCPKTTDRTNHGRCSNAARFAVEVGDGS
jgi:hypothetical protein